MATPAFTVIITTYNRKELLTRSIESICLQTFRDFELLVIDNGCTDGTGEVVASLREPRLVYLRNPSPSTSCDAPRNLGISRACGSFIAFLDDDDLWYPERLERVKEAFDAHPDAAAVCHNEMRRVNGELAGMIRFGPWTEDFYERLLYEGNLLSSCGTTVRAEVLRECKGFDARPELTEVADFDLWIRMAERGKKFFFIEEPLGEFTLTGRNYSVMSPSFGAKQALMVRKHIYRYEKTGYFALSVRGARKLFQLSFIAGRSFIKRGKHLSGVFWLLRAISYLLRHPSIILHPRPRTYYGA